MEDFSLTPIGGDLQLPVTNREILDAVSEATTLINEKELYPEIYPGYFYNFLDDELDNIAALIGETRDSVKVFNSSSIRFTIKLNSIVTKRVGYKTLPFIHYCGYGENPSHTYNLGYLVRKSNSGVEDIEYL